MKRKTYAATGVAITGVLITGLAAHIGISSGNGFLGGVVSGLGGILTWGAGHIEGVFDHD